MTRQSRVSALIFLLALAVMILEVALTRVFSFITYHHMTYLVIAVAMLGFGAAGTFLTVRGASVGPTPAGDARLAHHATLFGAATLVALVLFPRIHFYPMDMYHLGDQRNLVSLFFLITLTAGPFFFGGVCIALILSAAGASVNRVYLADLAGSATGALLAIGLINSAGAMASSVVAAGIAIGAGALVAPRRRWLRAAAGVGILALSPLSESGAILPLHVPPGKQLFGAESTIETVSWHVITRLDVGRPMECACSFGGSLSPRFAGPPPLARLIFQDGSNLTGIIHPTPTPEETPVLGYFLQGAPYVIRPRARGLVIGSGGGIDVMVALHHHAANVVAVDVNPKTMHLVRSTYGDFAGHVFDRPDVEPVVSEGRHFLGRDARRFDVIQLSGVDTWAAQASGAYALTENFIYTAEAFDQYLAHLQPEGILGFSRPFVDPPLETFRLMATALDALDRIGVVEPSRHLLIVAGHGLASDVPWAEILVKRAPFTEREVQDLSAFSQRLGFDVVFDPLTPSQTALDGLGRSDAAGRDVLLSAYPLNVRPVTDDAPFYFQYHRWRDLLDPPLGLPAPMAMWILAGSGLQVFLLSALVVLYPLWRRRSGATARGGRAGIFSYFASLGLGFIFVEVALLQKLTVFLGGPAYALSITLFTLLLSSGLGSFASERAAARPLRLMAAITPALAGLIVLLAFFLDSATHHLMALSLVGRAMAAVVLIAPLGLLMGMPFPAGLRYVGARRPELLPWAWGINACATVVGTTTCMLVVSSFGFRAALLVGAAAYLVGWGLLSLSHRLESASPAATDAA
jgi:hypothetical protein